MFQPVLPRIRTCSPFTITTESTTKFLPHAAQPKSSHKKSNLATKTTTTTTTTTTAMKAIHVNEFIKDFSNVGPKQLEMKEHVDRPTLKKDQLLAKVLACSISPGDIIMVQGNLIFMHPEKFPFVPGMDICGIVEDANGHDDFAKGDIVVASNGISAEGGMAEYMAIPKEEAVKKPSKVSALEGACSSSAITARNAVLDNVQKGDRVLILGGSGGVGSASIQLAKHQAMASFVATTSTQKDLCTGLGADLVIDYKTQNWWEQESFQRNKFDVIIDTVGGGNFVSKAAKVLKTGKEGGTFVAVSGDDPKPVADTWWKAIKFFANLPLRPLQTWLKARTLPKYILLMPYDIPQGRREVLDYIHENKLRIPIDQRGPLPFTEDGVKKAFEMVASGHAHGKVVVSMRTESDSKENK